MTTKDYIYLGMIVLTALAFYCNGFYAGVYRCKKMYDSLLEDAEDHTHSEAAPDKSLNAAEQGVENLLVTNPPERENSLHLSNRELRGDFGKN